MDGKRCDRSARLRHHALQGDARHVADPAAHLGRALAPAALLIVFSCKATSEDPSGFAVDLAPNPNLVNEVTATFGEPDLVVQCEGETTADDPWPEEHRFVA